MNKIKSSAGNTWIWKRWRVMLMVFPEGVSHPNQPKVRWGFKIVKANMLANGPTCLTKRWWVYTRKPAFCLDYEPKTK